MENTKIIWEDSPSQGVNLGIFLSCFFIVTWPWALWCYYSTRATTYKLTEDKLYIDQRLFNNRGEEVLLDRIEEVQIQSSLFLKLLGLSTILIKTSSHLCPILKLKGLEDASTVKNIILRQVEEAKKLTASLQPEN